MTDKNIGLENAFPSVWKVLVVDPDEQVHRRTREELEDLVFLDMKIEQLDAYSCDEALRILQENRGIAVAMIDVILEKGSDGLNLTRAIRRELRDKLIRIILRTDLEESFPHEQIMVEYDINDLKSKSSLAKTKLRAALITAFRSYRDLSTITNLNHSLEKMVQERTQALSEANLKLRSYISTLENDQAAGGRMQQKLLPEKEKSFGDTTFSSRVYSSMYLSGDFLDYFEIDSHRIGFYMADVSGHGISSAFITVILKNFLDSQLEYYWNEGDPLILKPLLLMRRLNGEILRENFGKYLTIFYGVLDQKRNTLQYANCGQFPYPLLRDSGGIRSLKSSGTPIGLFPQPEVREEEIEFQPEASLLIISDGILEILPNGSVKEKLNFISSFFNKPGLGLEGIAERLGLSRQFSFPDDITFMMVDRRNSNG